MSKGIAGALVFALLILCSAPVAAEPLSISRFELADNIPIVEVWINGKGPFDFAVDSGATWMVLSPQLANQLSLRPTGFRNVSGGGPKSMRAPSVTLDSLRVGRLAVKQMEAYVVPLPPALFSPPRRKRHIVGLLGETLFHRYVTVIDYETSELAFFDRATYAPPQHAVALPMTLVFGGVVPAVTVSVDAQSGVFVLDTGSGAWPIATATFAKAALDQRYPAGKSEEAQGAGGSYSLRTICVTRFALGEQAFARVPMYVETSTLGLSSEGDFQGNLGYQVLRHFAVTLDFDNATVYLTPNAGGSAYKHC